MAHMGVVLWNWGLSYEEKSRALWLLTWRFASILPSLCSCCGSTLISSHLGQSSGAASQPCSLLQSDERSNGPSSFQSTDSPNGTADHRQLLWLSLDYYLVFTHWHHSHRGEFSGIRPLLHYHSNSFLYGGIRRRWWLVFHERVALASAIVIISPVQDWTNPSRITLSVALQPFSYLTQHVNVNRQQYRGIDLAKRLRDKLLVSFNGMCTS